MTENGRKEMKKAIGAIVLSFIAGYCAAEPGQIDKTAIMSAMSANTTNRDGVWLKWACDEYRSWFEEPGTLWKKTDTKRENLGAGLCAGFIAGVTSAPGMKTCISQQAFSPKVVSAYLQDHPEHWGKPAGQLVVDALSANGGCQ
jgi:hypothetical protein